MSRMKDQSSDYSSEYSDYSEPPQDEENVSSRVCSRFMQITFLRPEFREKCLHRAYKSSSEDSFSERTRSDRIESREIVKNMRLHSQNGDNISEVKLAIQRNALFLRFEKSAIHQWGVRAAIAFKAGTPLIEYIGQKVRRRVIDKRQTIYEGEGNNGSYIFRIDDDTFVDATKKGGLARFINHSCDPNCETKVLNFDGVDHVFIFSRADIDAGDELTYDYLLPYEKKSKAIKCLCGSKKCRGWLNYSEKEEEKMYYSVSQEIPNSELPYTPCEDPEKIVYDEG